MSSVLYPKILSQCQRLVTKDYEKAKPRTLLFVFEAP